ncbi:ATP-binding protein [Leucobacter sp. NPDC058333]|uniref:ATP-binding protein n=1 Tax=Leucobacter sp. NPDC058333 TaxID=3346450 RepID=UPI00364D1806
MGRRSTPSATSSVFLILTVGVLIVSIAVTAVLVWDSRRAEYRETERATHAVAVTLAAMPTVVAALGQPLDAAPVVELQREMSRLGKSAGVSYITVMTVDGTRYTHPDPTEIGGTYRGTIPRSPHPFTERWTGTLGPSVRTIAPVSDASGTTIGWVSVGITVESIGSEVARDLPLVFTVSGVFVAAGLVAALLGRRVTRRITGDLSASAVRDALVSHDSLRTLSESLRAQTHEHSNRLHTAIALLELGRTEAAIDMFTETSRRSQAMIDLVVAPDSFDPAVSALIVGKSAQAGERGVALDVQIDPELPVSPIDSMELVSVVGNLLDNAIDAAAIGRGRPRCVKLRVYGELDDALGISVSDSGDGIADEVRDAMFTRGVSTKPAALGDAFAGRGVGLALVVRIVHERAGVLTVEEDPTTFTVVLPGTRSARSKRAAQASGAQRSSGLDS